MIDMQDPANFRKAWKLARVSSNVEHWGPIAVEWAASLPEKTDPTSTHLEAVYAMDGDETVCVAITGNGPNSRANAEFFASARNIVFGLVDEIDRLKDCASAARREAALTMADLIKQGVDPDAAVEMLCPK